MYFDPYNYKSLPTCESSLKVKMTKALFTRHGESMSKLLKLVHIDVCETMTIQARSGYCFFITLTNDMSRFQYVYLMKYKFEAIDRFKEYRAEVAKQARKCIKALQSNRGGEYLTREFLDCLKENVIVSKWTPPSTPQHNRIAKRRNCILYDVIHVVLQQSPQIILGIFF